jgi:hypothetical protein
MNNILLLNYILTITALQLGPGIVIRFMIDDDVSKKAKKDRAGPKRRSGLSLLHSERSLDGHNIYDRKAGREKPGGGSRQKSCQIKAL